MKQLLVEAPRPASVQELAQLIHFDLVGVLLEQPDGTRLRKEMTFYEAAQLIHPDFKDKEDVIVATAIFMMTTVLAGQYAKARASAQAELEQLEALYSGKAKPEPSSWN